MKKLLCLFFLITWAGFLHAQIVNIEDRRVVKKDTSGWFGRTDLGFNWVKNTREIFTISGRLQLEYLQKKHYVLSSFSYDLVKAAENDFINDGFAHLRYNYHLAERWTYEAFTQAQYNERINLRFRGLMGTGMRYLLLHINQQKLYWGMAYMFEYNEETEPEIFFRDHRISTYLSGRFPLTAFAVLSGTTYYQPVLTNLSDWRLSSHTNLELTISSRLKFTTSFKITYDSRVPDAVPNTIFSFINGLRWNF